MMRAAVRPNHGIFRSEKQAVQAIVERLGSTLDPDSDFDLLVVARPNGGFGSDDYELVDAPLRGTAVAPCSAQDFADRAALPTLLVVRVMAEGKRVYARRGFSQIQKTSEMFGIERRRGESTLPHYGADAGFRGTKQLFSKGLAIASMASVVLSTSAAVACSCPPPPQEVKENDAASVSEWRKSQAKTLVHGKITDIQAGESVLRFGRRVVLAKLRIDSVIKGDATTGETSVMTLFGAGDCGVPAFFLASVAWDRAMTVELRSAPEAKGEYYTDSCGYGQLDAATK